MDDASGQQLGGGLAAGSLLGLASLGLPGFLGCSANKNGNNVPAIAQFKKEVISFDLSSRFR